MHFARSLITAILVAMPAAGVAGECRSGSNMPAGDANPAKPIDPQQARMVCSEGTLTT